MAEEAGSSPELVKKAPNMASAIYAINAASEMLNTAKEKYEKEQYIEAFRDSRNAIRIASSALLFRDGYIASTLDANVGYLSEKYPGQLPVERWRRIEITGEGPGLADVIAGVLGKKLEEEKAGDAISVAEKFVGVIKTLMRLEL